MSGGGRFSELRADGAGLGQDEASEGEGDGQDEAPQREDDGQELFVGHPVSSLSLARVADQDGIRTRKATTQAHAANWRPSRRVKLRPSSGI